MLRTLLPAFTAGAYIALRVGAQGLLAALSDGLTEGIALLDERGAMVYENPVLHQLLEEEAEAARVERECADLGRAVLATTRRSAKSRPDPAVGPRPLTLRTTAAAYDLRGALVGPGVLGPGPMAIVVLERTTPSRHALEGLRARFHLTPRELAVSRLLAEGRSNDQLAARLGVSIHTARRHVEHVLMKLGVHSRAAVGAKLRERLPGA
jgi:DNA-binding CsgD family transcriptional regulator